MRNIIYKSIAIVLGIVFVDFSVGYFHDFISAKLNENCRTGQAARANYAINAVDADLLIIGSSPVMCGYNPQIFEDYLDGLTNENWHVFNASVTSQGIQFSEIALLSAIDRESIPKVVILDVSEDWLSREVSEHTLSILHPYYKRNRYVTKFIDTFEDNKTKLFLKSNLWRCRGNLLSLVVQFFKSGGSKGFEASYNELTMDDENFEIKKNDKPIIYYNVKSLENIINAAKSYNIKLIVTITPRLQFVDKECASYKKLFEICEENQIPFFDYGNDSRFMHGEYFRDDAHLNARGAEVYSQIVYETTKDILLNSD